VTKEDHNKAAALKYRRGFGSAPTNVAIGREAVAIIIIDLARAHGVPIHEDRNLVEILSTMDQYEGIPTLWYKAVADTLAFIHKMAVVCERTHLRRRWRFSVLRRGSVVLPRVGTEIQRVSSGIHRFLESRPCPKYILCALTWQGSLFRALSLLFA